MKNIFISICVLSGLIASGVSQASAFILELDLNTGYNNNVFLESDDLVVNEEEEGADQTDYQTQLAVTANYEFWDQPSSDASIMVDYFKESLLSNDLDTTVTTFSLPVHYYRDDYRYGMTFTRQSYNLSGVDVLNYFIGKFGVAKNVGDDKLYVNYLRTSKTPKDVSYTEYEGTSHAGSVKYKRNDGTQKWSVQFNLFRNDYLGEGLSNDGAYIKAVYNLNRGRHSMSVGAKFKGTQYEVDALTDDERQDRQSSLNYNHEYFWSPAIQLYFDSSYIRNQSNIDYDDENYNYDQWIHTFGTRFVF